MDAQHSEAVKCLAEQIRELHGQFRVYHGSTNSTRFSGRRRGSIVNTSGLNKVLHIDTEREIAIVQSSCPMDKLVKATLPFGLIPPVVPEFPGITVGGAYAGTAGESSSFKYGLFDATVERIEIILADGEVKNASREENHDLFIGAAGTLGTLGIITLLEVKLQKAKKYVQIRFKPVNDSKEAVSCIEDATRDSRNDFIEGIMFNSSGVVILGQMTDVATKPVVRFTRPWDPWFYLYAHSKIHASDGEAVDYTLLVDYLFRHDRGCFWTGELAFQYFLTPFNRFTRFMLDYFMHARVAYRAFHASGLSRQYFVQDIAFPSQQVSNIITFVDEELGIQPIWLCPLKLGQIGLMPKHLQSDTQMLYNIGIWGQGPKCFDKFVAVNRHIEARTKHQGGIKWLYAQVFYSEEEFWNIYSREEYDELRVKYKAKGPTVYDKITQDMVKLRESIDGECWPMRGLWGLWKTLIRSDNILI